MFRILYILLLSTAIICISAACKDELSEEEFKSRFLGEVNALRETGCLCGEDSMPPVQPLVWSDELEVAAERHLNDMIEHDFLQHTGSDNSTPRTRAADALFPGDYIGENIARAYITINDVMNQWTTSPSHCQTMMDEKFRYMAVVYREFYWVQVLGNEE